LIYPYDLSLHDYTQNYLVVDRDIIDKYLEALGNIVSINLEEYEKNKF